MSARLKSLSVVIESPRFRCVAEGSLNLLRCSGEASWVVLSSLSRMVSAAGLVDYDRGVLRAVGFVDGVPIRVEARGDEKLLNRLIEEIRLDGYLAVKDGRYAYISSIGIIAEKFFPIKPRNAKEINGLLVSQELYNIYDDMKRTVGGFLGIEEGVATWIKLPLMNPITLFELCKRLGFGINLSVLRPGRGKDIIDNELRYSADAVLARVMRSYIVREPLEKLAKEIIARVVEKYATLYGARVDERKVVSVLDEEDINHVVDNIRFAFSLISTPSTIDAVTKLSLVLGYLKARGIHPRVDIESVSRSESTIAVELSIDCESPEIAEELAKEYGLESRGSKIVTRAELLTSA